MKVLKLGGSSLKNPVLLKRLVRIIQQEPTRPLVVVVSAMGNTTRQLEKLFRHALKGQIDSSTIQDLCTLHQNNSHGRSSDRKHAAQHTLKQWEERLIGILADVSNHPNPQQCYSDIMIFGELLSTQLIAYYLREQKLDYQVVDARNFIQTKGAQENAIVDFPTTEALIQQHLFPAMQESKILLTQGFIGRDSTGATTTLGKEGSDLTGAIIATALHAPSFTVWKDVPGVMNADPQYLPGAQKIHQLPYTTMETMAYHGAKILHPQTIQPLATKGIPLYIRSFLHPEEPGTVVNATANPVTLPLYMLRKQLQWLTAHKHGQAPWEPKDTQQVQQYLQHTPIYLMESTPSGASFCLDEGLEHVAAKHTLQKHFVVHLQHSVSLLTVMNYTGSLPPSLLQRKHVLYTHQKGNTYQAILQQEDRIEP